MYTLITGAHKNVGDFLIVERGKQLLRRYANGKEFLEFDNQIPLTNHLKEINKTNAIILCGGPGYTQNLFRNYPFLRNIDKIKVPVIPFAVGWCGHPADNPDKFSFSDDSKSVLEYIHKNCEFSSCRDKIMKEILKRQGIENVLMTGDTALYDLKSIGKKFTLPRKIRKVAVSVAQHPGQYHQNIYLLEQVKQTFPEAELICCFHRNLKADKFTPETTAKGAQKIAQSARKLGYRVVDASYDTSKIEFYRECDLHIGYRVHAHIFFLSIRKPTFLLQEDGRGLALSKTVSLPDIPAWNRRIPESLRGRGYRLRIDYYLGKIFQNKNAVDDIMRYIKNELRNNFPHFQEMDKVIDDYHRIMIKFLKTLP
ncbi:MAG: hypothetical protein DRP84_10860 [Spirochaetes bacterium]|nr:MAG: hypothetical protein DRP84_10860 [Spirochaetota bacterium]